jgi:vitamin B12 transporter
MRIIPVSTAFFIDNMKCFYKMFRVLPTIATLIFSSLSARADNTVSYTLTDTTVIRLAGVDVNANRTRSFSRTGRVVEEISAVQLSELPITAPDALLRQLPGVDIRQRGVGSTQADISIRGGSFDQVLVLINGINVTDPQTGHHNLNLPIDMQDLQGVEVLHGAASRRYGSQAFSGAVNFKTGPGDTNNLKVDLSAGAWDTRAQQLSFSTGKKIRNYTSLGNYSSDGYRINTDYAIRNIYNRTTWQTKKWGTFDAQVSNQRKSFGANGFYGMRFPNQFEHTRTRLLSLGWEKSIDQLSLNASVYQRRHYDRFELYRNFEGATASYTQHNYHLTHVRGASMNASLSTEIGLLTAGVDLKNDHIYSTRLGQPIGGKLPRNTDERRRNIEYTHEAQRNLSNAYLGYSGAVGPLFVSAGTALSYSEEFGLKQHYGADINYLLTHELSAFLSANTASRLPTFTDLYYRDPIRQSNPELTPETARTYEGGVAYRQKNLGVKAGVFTRVGENIIDWIRYPGQTVWVSENLTALTTTGFYVGAEYLPSGGLFTRLSLSYQWMNADKKAEGFDSMYALDYLKHQLSGTVHHTIARNVSAGWTVLLKDRSGHYEDVLAGAQVDYVPFVLLSSRVTWKLKRTQLYADVNNLLNVHYVDLGGLPMPGFHLSAGLKWQLRR